MTFLSQARRKLGAPATIKRYLDAVIGIIFIPLAQILVVPIQMALNARQVDIPASTLVMMLVLLFMLLANRACEGIHGFFVRRLKGPMDFLGRHMAFGFVASFVMLSRDHVTDLANIGRIAGAFVIVTFAGYTFSFWFASGVAALEQRLRATQCHRRDSESGDSGAETPRRRTSGQVGQDEHRMSALPPKTGPEVSVSAVDSAPVDMLVASLPLSISVVLLCVAGLPIYCATGYDMPFEALCFVVFWICAVLFQRALKGWKRLRRRPGLRAGLAILANPVLLTAAVGTAYFWAKTALTHRGIDDVLSDFRHDASWAAILGRVAADHAPRAHIGAGDLATALLDAGIVSLGFKMFEYRRELWSSCATVLSASAALAAVNVFLNVAVAHRALGLRAHDALAFAARSVTIALGVPAVNNLHGSTTLVSALAVFSGMLWQMGGDLMLYALKINDRRALEPDGGDSEDGDGEGVASSLQPGDSAARNRRKQERGIVATGVTVGINAAAMGTSHLIERDSKATAYSALAMTVFGAMTVVLTSIPAISRTLISIASG